MPKWFILVILICALGIGLWTCHEWTMRTEDVPMRAIFYSEYGYTEFLASIEWKNLEVVSPSLPYEVTYSTERSADKKEIVVEAMCCIIYLFVGIMVLNCFFQSYDD